MSLPAHPLTGQRARLRPDLRRIPEPGRTDRRAERGGLPDDLCRYRCCRSAAYNLSRNRCVAAPRSRATSLASRDTPGSSTSRPRNDPTASAKIAFGHPRSPAPACRRTPQARPPCPAARSVRVSPGGTGVPVPGIGPMKQAQAAAAGMALLALMFAGCPAKAPAGPGPARAPPRNPRANRRQARPQPVRLRVGRAMASRVSVTTSGDVPCGGPGAGVGGRAVPRAGGPGWLDGVEGLRERVGGDELAVLQHVDRRPRLAGEDDR